jgi:hypothetical protein
MVMDRIVYCIVQGGNIAEAYFDKADAEAAARGGGMLSKEVYNPELVAKAVLQRLDGIQRLCLEHRQDGEDRIVYPVIANGGGIDGRDPSDKGGKVTKAYFHKGETEKNADGWSHIGKPIVVVPSEVAQRVIDDLNPVELLCLEDHLNKMAAAPTPRRPGR